ncbi:MAG: alpha/beta hydrolase [Betaproteobacteria bacterium]|nr:alpha/beta hydrolase [Betaproteobacteria bacterium]
MPLTATEPRRAHLCSLSAHGFHRVNYWDWGDPGNPRVAICVHGLARNGRDFDVLAEALSPTHRVLAVDMPGRGDSEWLADANDYGFPTYLTTLTALIARSGADTVDWIGTSMGGLLGMAMAAQPGSPIARLVVNDVGPVIEAEALARIATYLGLDPTFASLAEGERYIRTVSAPFGALTDEQWRHLTASNVRERADGRWGLAYDPGIAVPFRAAPAPSDLWGLWDAIRCPTLLLRGAESDLLSAATAAAMRSRGPRPAVIEFPGVGHAPMLLDAAQTAPVVAFLRERAPAPGP